MPQLCVPSILDVAMHLKNQVALITGSGRGIGRAIARLFAEEGASVFLTARTEAQLASVAKEVEATRPSSTSACAAFVPADLTQEADCRRVFDAARGRFGRVDILVNNAGHYGPVVPVEEYPLADFDSVLAVHLRAAFLLSQLALPEMYARGSGVILNISSLSAKSAFAWGSAYAAAKAGMLGLTRVTAAEAARKGVRVNALCPGPVTETEMSKDLGRHAGEKTWRRSENTTGRAFSAPSCKAAVKPPPKSRAPHSSFAPTNRVPSPARRSTSTAAPPSSNPNAC